MSVLDRTPRRAEGSSRDAGEHLAQSGKTSDLKRMILRSLRPLGPLGLTAKEIELETGLSHGQVSSALSTLHEDGYIERLTEKRSRHEVYVLPDDVKALAVAALRHRLVLSPAAEIEGREVETLVGELVENTEAPR